MSCTEEKIRFQEITEDPKRLKESLINNYEEWGNPLSLDEYLIRESRLHNIHCKNGLEHRTFALIDKEKNIVIAACEVLTRPLYHGGGIFTKDNCIASVFVDPSYRNRDYCKVIMQNVVDLLTKANPEHQISLWSDIGDYYARVGFNFPPSFQSEPQWNRSIICAKTDPYKTSVNCDFLDAHDTLTQIVPEHQRLLRRDADTLYIDCQGEINVAVVLPHRGLYEQLQFRAIYTAEKLGLSIPTKFAARTPDGHGWISWTYMFNTKKLMILGMYGSANEMAMLLVAATAAAAEYNFQAELHESSIVEPQSDIEELIAAMESINLKVSLKERDYSLPMYIGPGIWVFQGGYAWY